MKLYTAVIASLIVFLSCSKEDKLEGEKIVDIFERRVFVDSRDQNSYKTLVIGNQEWMVENLRYRPKRGSVDGCWSYGESAVDSSKVVIDKADFKKAVLVKHPKVGTWGNPFMWVWMLVDDNFVNSRGSYYKKSWAAFKEELLDPYYGAIPLYEPFINDMDSIENALFEAALIKTLDGNVIKDKLSKHGYLYEYRAIRKIVPEGWRIPTDDDFKALEKSLGLSERDIEVKEEWRGQESIFKNELAINSGFGGTVIYGINNQRTPYRNVDFRSYYWTSTVDKEISEIKHVYIRGWQSGIGATYRGTHVDVNVANSVICVRDLK